MLAYKKRFIQWYHSSFGNELEKIIDAFPFKRWDARALSHNPNVSLGMVLKHSHIQWRWDLLTINPGMLPRELSNLKYPWTVSDITSNPSVSDILVRNVDLRYSSDEEDKIYICTYFPLISGTVINTHIKIDLLPFSVIRKKSYWNMKILSMNPSIPLSYIERNTGWDYRRLSLNPNVTAAYIRKHIKEAWNWQYLTRYVRWEEIKNNLDLPWDMNSISQNIHVTLNVVKENLDIKWHLHALLTNPNIDPEELQEVIPYQRMTFYCPEDDPDVTVSDVEDDTDFHRLSSNRLIWDDSVYVKRLWTCRNKRRAEVLPFLESLLIKDVLSVIKEYIDYE